MGQRPDNWLSKHELERKLDLRQTAVSKMMANGTLKEGVHWFRRGGSRPLFWWPAVTEWLKGNDDLADYDLP